MPGGDLLHRSVFHPEDAVVVAEESHRIKALRVAELLCGEFQRENPVECQHKHPAVLDGFTDNAVPALVGKLDEIRLHEHLGCSSFPYFLYTTLIRTLRFIASMNLCRFSPSDGIGSRTMRLCTPLFSARMLFTDIVESIQF